MLNEASWTSSMKSLYFMCNIFCSYSHCDFCDRYKNIAHNLNCILWWTDIMAYTALALCYAVEICSCLTDFIRKILKGSSFGPHCDCICTLLSKCCIAKCYTHVTQVVYQPNVQPDVWWPYECNILMLYFQFAVANRRNVLHCVSKNVLTLKRYSSKLQGVILMKFGRNIQNTLE